MYDAILEALRSGAHDDALAQARALVDDHPEDPQALRWLAIAQAQAGQPKAALETIGNAIERAPEDAELHLVRGSLLLAAQQREQAGEAFATATALDPNQVPAYFLQAQLALARGDADEAERQARLAARLVPEHPQLDVIEGLVELRRGRSADALKRLTAAASKAGQDDPQLLYALGHAHLQEGHLAFAEEAFARLLDRQPETPGLRLQVADLRLRQDRPDEALDVLQPLLARPEPGFALQRLAGMLELASGRPRRALPWLRAAFERRPGDQQLLFALVDTWQRLGMREEAIESLEAALATHPAHAPLWQSRMTFVAPGGGREVLDRWLEALPEDADALEMLATAHDFAGRRDEAIAVTRRVVALAPGRHLTSELKLAGLELETDPPSAVGRLQAMLEHHPQPERQGLIRARLVEARDRAGEQATLVTEWKAARAEDARAATSPPPAPTAAPSSWPARGTEAADAPAVALLWGPPGAGAGLLAELAAAAGLPILRDRFGPGAPDDPLQDPAIAPALASGEHDAAGVVADWRAVLPSRGVANGPVIDWLPWWDNALLHALRPHLPGARLLVVLRDPRDLLLNWLAFGAPVPMPSPVEGARWLAAMLSQIADLRDGDLQPHRIMRVDDALGRADRMMDALNVALDTDLPTPNRPMYAGPRLAPGRWRAYGTQLGEAFAELHAVSARLGYPEA